jgi:hydrogenase expression/formation protein HypD
MDLLVGIRECVTLLEAGRVAVLNCYGRSVRRLGNVAAQRVIEQAYVITDGPWRGFGVVPRGVLRLRSELSHFDALQRFGAVEPQPRLCGANDCRAADVLAGRIKPPECRHFGASCTPEAPLGAPMVSSEGACAAYHRYATHGAP